MGRKRRVYSDDDIDRINHKKIYGNSGGWTPRTTGTTEDDQTVTFREGLGNNEGHTLIADGEKSDRSFRREHNHYGPNREGGNGRVEDEGGDRGHYTGPGK